MNDNSTTAAANGQLPLKLTWQSIDPSANRYRYFVLRVDEDLCGNPCVVRRWGRIGSENLRERYVWPESKVELERWVRHVCRARANATLAEVTAMTNQRAPNPELQARLHQLTPAMAEHPDVIAVYLFGSQAAGDGLPTSDVDIAYLLDSPNLDRELEIEVTITRILGTDDADVQLLNKAPLPFQYRVISSGRVVYSRTEAERHRYETAVRNAYEADPAQFEVSRQDLLQLLR